MSVDVREKSRQEPLPSIPIEKGLADTFDIYASQDLPVYNRKDQIIELIQNNDTIILEADTGSGKSTAGTAIALQEAQLRNPGGKVIVTQPRVVAAEGLFDYLSKTLGDKVGIRHGKKNTVDENTQLEFAVEESLLNDIVKRGNKDLDGVDTVVIDEAHEKSANSALLMAFVKKAQERRKAEGKKPLKLIITSATLDSDQMKGYFPGAGHLKVEGRMFPVQEIFEPFSVSTRELTTLAAKKAAEIHAKGDQEPGDMLIFMPGVGEINSTIEALNAQANLVRDGVEFIPISGGENSAESSEKLYKPSDKRRIFVSTNVAETSVTIPSVRVVIDSGLAKVNVFDSGTGVSSLETQNHTKANAKQRKGRAGRTDTGTVHYLFTKEELDGREDHLSAEILRTDMASLVLLMKEMGIQDIHNFDFIDKPEPARIDQAYASLTIIGALDKDGNLTEIGRQMAKENLEPRYARIMVEARKLGCEKEVALAIGLLRNSSKDVFKLERNDVPVVDKYKRFIDPASDVLTRINVWNEYVQNRSSDEAEIKWGEENGINTKSLKYATRDRGEILGIREKDKINERIELTDEMRFKIILCLVAGSADGLVVTKGVNYRIYTGLNNIKIGNKSIFSGKLPDSFISNSLRARIHPYNGSTTTEANLNTIFQFEDAIKIAPNLAKYFPERAPKPEAPKPSVEPEQSPEEKVREEIKKVEYPVGSPLHPKYKNPKKEDHGDHEVEKTGGIIKRLGSIFRNPFKRGGKQ